jgi:ribonuclease P protein component
VYRFLSKHHIRVARDFDAVFKQGKRLVDSCFAFHFLKVERDYPRLGMVISKRNCALAVNRNRIKRLIREEFRLNQHTISNIDLVVALKSPSKKMSDQELSECVKKLFSQLIARCDGSSSN